MNWELKASIAVLGLDGMPKDLLVEAMARGWMPFLNSVRGRLVWKQLDPIVPLTPPSWTSIMSGVNPGKHGIYDFYKYEVISEGIKARLYTSMDLNHPRIHEMASMSGYREVTIVNPMPGYPILPTKARVISFLHAPKPVTNISESMGDKLAREGWERSLRLLNASSCGQVIDRALEVLEFYREMVFSLRKDRGLYWFTSSIPDEIFHKCPKAFYKPDIISRLFEEIDAILRYMWNEYDTVFVVSDHGSTRYRAKINVNKVLYDNGFIVPGEVVEERETHKKQGLVKVRMPRILIPLIRGPLRVLARSFFQFLRDIAGWRGKRLALEIPRGIDYSKSKAYMPPTTTPWYYVVLRDSGSVGEVKRALSREGLIVLSPEEVFSGERISEAPGLIVLWNEAEGFMAYAGSIYEPRIIKRKTVNHGRYGILVYKPLEGLDWLERFSERSPERLPNHIVAPLLMAIMGVPISSASDSLPLLEKYGGLKPKMADYRVKWLLIKKIASAI
ncbi:MAG: alkaline phosphatase family protein [Desulfurococcales archaeon]|nr:alkaline phosphatase family protein [Desulfurococcales archaeon]